MVLSNKKLKQRLRRALTESVTASVTKPDPTTTTTNRDPDSQPQKSLKQLIDSVTQKPRLSKREKRRKTSSLYGSNTENNKISSSNVEEEEKEKMEVEVLVSGDGDKKSKKRKKRKREDDKENNKISSSNVEEEEKEKMEVEVLVSGDGDKKSKKRKREDDKDVKEAKKKKSKYKNKNKKKKEAKSDGEKGVSEEQGVVETDKNGESQVNEEIPTKVYVGGIPYYSTEDDIQSYFEGCGTITEIDCMKFPDSGKFRGIAIINFKTEGAAKRALALDGSEMGELSLKIQPYKTTRPNRSSDFAPKVVEGYNRIYVGNLSWDITEDELRKFFTDCNISSIRWGMDKVTEEFRGYAHVDFSDSLSLMMALKLDQEIVCGRPVKISCAVPKKGAHTYSKSVPTKSEGADTGGLNSVPTSEGADTSGLGSISGKIRRRTCYECGEKGHLSSACPKKQTAAPSIPKTSIENV